MFEYISTRFFDWMTYEPVVGLMMIVASVALFAGAYARRSDDGSSLTSWLRRILEAGALAVLFLGLLWAFRAVLNDNTTSFAQDHGRVSEANYRSLQTIWGAPHVQRELEVGHYRTVTVREETWRDDPSLPPLFREKNEERRVAQNSILSSKGSVELKTNQRRKGSALYNGFEASFAMTYVVTNASTHATRADLVFPLSGQVLYDELRVIEDETDISPELRVSRDGIRWSRQMKPGDTLELAISYRTRGVEHFYYQVPQPRELRDFELVMNIDGMSVSDVNYPEGCLTPHTVESQGSGTRLTWTLDRAVTTAGMGVALPKPTQPGAQVSQVLRRSPYALMMLVVAVSLTLLVRRQPVRLLDLSLLSATFCALFLTMAAISDYVLGFWGALGAGATLALGLAWLLYRKHPSRIPILGLVGFFTAIYPLSGLVPDHAPAFDGLVVVALIAYLFAISIRARLTQPAAVPA